MLPIFLLFSMCQLSDSAFKGRDLPSSLKTRWYGPSYQPKDWDPKNVIEHRSHNWGYDENNENLMNQCGKFGDSQPLSLRRMPFCNEELTFRTGAFEGSMIGLSIGVVLGTIRAISLEGVPHTVDETPCKTLISHVLGGFLSGALIAAAIVIIEQGHFLLHFSSVHQVNHHPHKLILHPFGSPFWSYQFEDCGGRRQSPINIETEDLVRKKTKKSLKFGNYSNVPNEMYLENSKHSIHLTGVWVRSSSTPFVTGGPLEKRYYFSQLHFHWGKTSDSGSEHKVNGKSFPVEMHVVHDRYLEDPTNVSEEGDSNHLVVVTYMLELSNKDNPALEPILAASRRVQGSQKKRTEVKPFPIDDIVEPFRGDYVTYQGSLTTPPCTEGVIWIINSKPLEISNNQLKILRNSVRNGKGFTFANDREVQPVNGRNIYYIYC